VALFVLGSAGAALAGTALHLALARAVQGAGGAFITPMTLTMLTRAFPPQQRAAIIGLWGGVSGLGLAAGPLVGGLIVNGWTWNAIFWVNVPVGLLVLVLGRLRLQESRGDRRPLDLPGIGLAAAGLLGLVYGLVRGNALGWGSPEIVAALAAGTLLVGAFLVRQRTARAPMIDLGLFGARGFWSANVVGFLMSFGMFGSIFLITLFIQDVQGYSALQAGLRTLPWTGTIMLTAPIAGIVAGRLGARMVTVAGMAAQAVALAWMAHVATATVPYSHLLPAFILGGLGMGLAFSPLSAAVMAASPLSQHGQASGVYSTLRELGGVFGVAVLGAIFQHVVTRPDLFVDGFRTALIAGAGVLALGATVATVLPAGQRDAAVPLVEEAQAA
jgi:EmrB/QacA subfamily drug resistance transporter